jgi:hypothetical protein
MPSLMLGSENTIFSSAIRNVKLISPYLTLAQIPLDTSSRTMRCTKKSKIEKLPAFSLSVAMRSSAPNQNYAYHSTIIARVKGLEGQLITIPGRIPAIYPTRPRQQSQPPPLSPKVWNYAIPPHIKPRSRKVITPRLTATTPHIIRIAPHHGFNCLGVLVSKYFTK